MCDVLVSGSMCANLEKYKKNKKVIKKIPKALYTQK